MTDDRHDVAVAVKDMLSRLQGDVKAVRVTTNDSLEHEGLCEAVVEAAKVLHQPYRPIYFDAMAEGDKSIITLRLCHSICDTLYDSNRFSVVEILLRLKEHILLPVIVALYFVIELVANFVDAASQVAVIGKMLERIQSLSPVLRICLLVIVVAGLVYFYRGQTTERNRYRKVVDQLWDLHSGGKELVGGKDFVTQFLDRIRRWAGRRHRYVLVANYLNWSFDQNAESLLSQALGIPNLYTIFIEDDDDISTEDDQFFAKLKDAGLALYESSMPKLDVCLFIQRLSAICPDRAFTDALRGRLVALEPGEYELSAIGDNLQSIQGQYEDTGAIRLAGSLGRTGGGQSVEELKISRLCSEYFEGRNKLSGSTADMNALFVGVFHAHVLLGTGLPRTLFEALYRLNDPDGQVFPDDVIADKSMQLTQQAHGMQGPPSVTWDYQQERFAVAEHRWVPEFVLSRVAAFAAKLPFLRALEQKSEYAKGFLCCVPCTHGQFEKLQVVLDSDAERVFFGIRHGLSLRSPDDQPQQEQNSRRSGTEPDPLMLSNRVLAQAWQLARQDDVWTFPLRVRVFQTEFDLSEQTKPLNPFETICYPIAAKMFGASSLPDLDVDAVLSSFPELGRQLPIGPYTELFEEAGRKLHHLAVRHRFNQGCAGRQDLEEYPLLRLLDHIEQRVCVLLPRVSPEHANEVPQVELDNMDLMEESFAEQNLNVLLLLVVSLVHNHFVLTARGGLEPRGEKTADARTLLRRVLDAVHAKLDALRDEPKGYLDELKYAFQRTNFQCMLKLCRDCGVDAADFMPSEDADITATYEAVQKGYEAIEHYFGCTEVLFWQAWFASRGILHVPMPQIEAMLVRLLEISHERLHYTYHEAEIVYMSCITNAALPPASAYMAIKRFFGSTRRVPPYLELEYLERLSVICFNGQFKERKELRAECIEASNRILSQFSDRQTRAERGHYQLAVAESYPHDSEERRQLLDQLRGDAHLLSPTDQADFYFCLLRHCVLKGEHEQVRDLQERAEPLLKANPFHYLQYLMYAINHHLPGMTAEARANALVDERQELVAQHNALVDELREREEASRVARAQGRWAPPDAMIAPDVGKGGIRELSGQIGGLEQEIRALHDIEPLYAELESTLTKFRARSQLNRLVFGEDHPARYVVAECSQCLADHYLGRGGNGRVRAIEYYETAVQQYLELEELIQAMRCILELRYCSVTSAQSEELLRTVERVIHMHSLGDSAAGQGSEEREIVESLLYDFFNARLLKTRSDYDFTNNIQLKIDKNTSSDDARFLRNRELYVHDSDTMGFRRALARYYFDKHSGKAQPELIADTDTVLACAEKGREELAHSDMLTMRRIVEGLIEDEGKEADATLRDVLALEERVSGLHSWYCEQVKAFVREELKVHSVTA